jgi:hypothetical protein
MQRVLRTHDATHRLVNEKTASSSTMLLLHAAP